jgi:putative thiamine transport system substrate-binding protein
MLHAVYFQGLCLAFAVTMHADSANADDFTDLQKAAKGQTVYFNAWGGDAKINSYISWAGQILADRHDITLVHVKLTDTASAVSRILAEKAAGRENGGSIDLLWVNGENFAAMKRAGLLQDRSWVTSLPNWRYTDSEGLACNPVRFCRTDQWQRKPVGPSATGLFL